MSFPAFFRFGTTIILVLVLAGVLTAPALAQKEPLSSIAVMVGDLGNPFFVRIAHGAEARPSSSTRR